MASISFLHDGQPFSGETLRTRSMGGTESSVVQLAEAMAQRGHKVTVFNRIEAASSEFGVHWRPLKEATALPTSSIAIAVSSAKLLRGVEARLKFLWLHNPVTVWKQFKRGQLTTILKTRPHLILLGRHHDAAVSKILPFSGRSILHHGVHPDFNRSRAALRPPRPLAVYTSQPYRGLDWIFNLWPEVRVQVPNAELFVFAPRNHQALENEARTPLAGVSVRGSLQRSELASELRAARVQLIPGHYDETYCLAAAEALASGVPVITRGHGALEERVRDGKTGFIAETRQAFIHRTVSALSDDTLWTAMHHACLNEAGLTTWDARAAEWNALFADLGLDQELQTAHTAQTSI